MFELRSSELPPSKSLYNRALILQSFEPGLKILSNSSFESEDVKFLAKALNDLGEEKKEFFCGAGAAPLKFLALRLSRKKGSFVIRGTERLFSRPLDDLKTLLVKLGSRKVVVSKNSLSFESTADWPETLTINAEKSSQLLSAIALSSWELEKGLEIVLESESVASESYLNMTLSLMAGAGWSGEFKRDNEKSKSLILPKKQFIVLDELYIEPDMSCAAALILAHVLKEGICLRGMIPSSLQGDQVIFSLLREMGYVVEAALDKEVPEGDVFSNLPQLAQIKIPKLAYRKGIKANLFSTPDLFPVLAAFAARVTSETELGGLKNLNIKESKRLDRMKELLALVGVKTETSEDSFKVFPSESLLADPVSFDPDQDHRLAMAAALLNLQGANIFIQNPEVVAKSFPNFWQLI